MTMTDATDTATSLPLTGIRVLELGNYIAAPTAGRLFADFGAEVIKVERPGSGDELRQWRLQSGTTSMLWRTMNRNKKAVTLNLRSEEGCGIVLDLVRHCDVVIENFRPGTLEKWGIGPEVMEAVRPDVILIRISGYGQTGPYRDRPGFGSVAEAMGGLRLLTGDSDRPPARVGISLADTISGMYAVIGALMILLQRARHGDDSIRRDRPRVGPRESSSPAIVDVALYESVLSLMESLLPDFDAHGVIRQRTGGRLEGIAPSNTYLCRDDTWVIIGGNGDAIFQRLMAVIGRDDLAADSQLAANPGRWQRRDELDEAITAWTRQHDSGEVLATLEAAGVPSGPIYDAQGIRDDPHFQARGMVQRHSTTDGERDLGDVVFPGVVPRLGDAPGAIRWLGPDLGAHNDDVYGDLLGLDPDRIAALRDDGII
jgi:formyl-CoA transferase